jgi:type IV secretory pathway VirB10-like protein
LVCVAVLLASYGIGLVIKKIRFAGVQTERTSSAETAKPDNKPESDDAKAVADEGGRPEPSEQVGEVAAEPAAEPNEDVASGPQRPGGRREMMDERMRERIQNMSEQERQEFMARRRERGGRRGGGGAFIQLSEQDRENFRAEMEQLGARVGEMSDEERRQARDKIFEKYGLPTGGGRRRPGGRD